MEQTSKQTAPFDPGFYRYTPQIDTQAILNVEEITKIKAMSQRKSIIIQSEEKTSRTFNLITAIYYGCVLYGSITAAKYKENPVSIEGNPFENEDFKEEDQQSMFTEAEYVIQSSLKLEKAVQFYLKRKSKLLPNILTYVELYLEFTKLNNAFIGINNTAQLKLPTKMQYFYDFSQDEILEKEKKLLQVVDSGSLSNVFNIS